MWVRPIYNLIVELPNVKVQSKKNVVRWLAAKELTSGNTRGK